MNESPPHVPQPFPYSFPGPNPIAAKANASAIIQRFALSSSRKPVSESSKRSRSSNASSSDESSSDEELEDPYSLQEPDRVDGAPSAASGGVELEENNIGMVMLIKLGWSQGKGLGKDLQGRTQPIDPQASVGMMGLGKATQDSRMMDKVIESASGPRELASQKMAKETEDQKKARMAKAAHMEAVQTSIAATLRSFHCEICDKKYANVGQYDEHTNSYDHHHRARAVATKAADLARLKATGESDKRREKERKREAKDMAKIMGAAGVPIPTVKAPVGAEFKKVEDKPKKAGGWAKVGGGGFGSLNASPSVALSSIPGVPKSSGWASIASVASSTTPTAQSSAPLPRSNPAFKSGGIFTLSDLDGTPPLPISITPQPLTAPPPPPPSHSVSPPPDSTYRPPPPPPPTHSMPPPPPSSYRATPPPLPHSQPPPPPPQYASSSQPSRSPLLPPNAAAPLRASFEMPRMNTSSYSQQVSSSRDPTNSRASFQSRESLSSRNNNFNNSSAEPPLREARRPSPPARDDSRGNSGRGRSRSRSRSRSPSSSCSSRSRSRSRSPVRRQRSRSPPRRDRINNSRSGQSIYQGQGGRDSYQGGGRNDRNTGGRQERGGYGDRSRNGSTRGGYGEERYRR